MHLEIDIQLTIALQVVVNIESLANKAHRASRHEAEADELKRMS